MVVRQASVNGHYTAPGLHEVFPCSGAHGCTISGAGPTCVAVVSSPETGKQVADAMVKAFEDHGNLKVNSARLSKLDQAGARLLTRL